mmetsp:Transcript_77467/g.136637  ORF Transcript_77467/g.136637 Transcript_77467/m.136637 type:complete len:1523 (-) Transcript_77467:273-4841(-)|eukprot:CAMPEP_0197623470 /NCGR_PEP_ID=MMETSP1338-20131121/3466_1 /TAXON_ID=43686 ORGANISM="Pelagodinium beii, Strain RCC1491" /NCGR_SAMPLE_ID=MMETSP1338 /ASSEMBLY_ACC=CAM_ASM_000754 /LENGTH=1522 /DNA_ID=CAMNT_0043193449 /DNA_START=111 /DNA_END=4679 /DNA_ORIENTATION=+
MSYDEPAFHWDECLASASFSFKIRYGLEGEEFEKARFDLAESCLAAVVMHIQGNSAGELVWATKRFQKFYGDTSSLLGQQNLDFLLPVKPDVHRALNGNDWDRPLQFKSSIDGAGNHKFMVVRNASGHHFWALMNAFSARTRHGKCVIYTLDLLQCQVPTSFDFTGGRDIKHAKIHPKNPLIQQWVKNVSADLSNSCRSSNSTVQTLLRMAEEHCVSLEALLADAFNGACFVPRTGIESAQTFMELGNWESIARQLEQHLKTVLELSNEVYESTKNDGAKAIACSVADPNEIDCPLVYISEGFEKLTNYKRAWALGRNCRFLQPRDVQQNMMLNGAELSRIKDFCSGSEATAAAFCLSFLLNETAEGEQFWNLLLLQFVRHEGKRFLFGVQIKVDLHRDMLDKVLSLPLSEGFQALESLRTIIQETSFSLKASLLALSDQAVSKWVLERSREEASFWEGEHYVPKLGLVAARDFQSIWPSLVDIVSENMQEMYEVSEAVLKSMCDSKNSKSPGIVAYSVSDPSSADCPLVFVSPGFEQITGYDCQFAVGRNCRFLQPNNAELNKLLNGEELRLMRTFVQGPGQRGQTIINLILNETRDGERFWNLLHMMYVDVKGKMYILGCQTRLELPMPSILHRASTYVGVEGYAVDYAVMSTFSAKLVDFLQQLRSDIAQNNQKTQSFAKITQSAIIGLLNFLKANCDDFEGDHWVPRMRLSEEMEEIEMTWRPILQSQSTLLSKLWEVSEGQGECVACAVADPSLQDCPLIYISSQFEELTGYRTSWVYGRNCRFLQPKLRSMNLFFNEEELLRMSEFCRERKAVGTRIVNLLVNESSNRRPFWNLLLMEHVEINGKPYILGIQTNLQSMEALNNILMETAESKEELLRLRSIFHSSESRLEQFTMNQFARRCLDEWVQTLPAQIELPSLQVSPAFSSGLPVANLLLSSSQDLFQQISTALEEGIRHFYLSLSEISGRFLDAAFSEADGRLLTLRLAEILHQLKSRGFHYIQHAVSINFITSPSNVQALPSLRKILDAHGYKTLIWLLEVKNANPAVMSSCWSQMSAAHAAGDVSALGILGGGLQTYEVWQKECNFGAPLSLWAIESFPGKDLDALAESQLSRLKGNLDRIGASLMYYNVLGSQNSILEKQEIQKAAASVELDPVMLVTKWAEALGCPVLLPKLRAEAMSVEARKGLAASLGRKSDSMNRPLFHRDWVQTYFTGKSPLSCLRALQFAAMRCKAVNLTEMTVQNIASHRSSLLNSRSIPGRSASPPSCPRPSVSRRSSTGPLLPLVSGALPVGDPGHNRSSSKKSTKSMHSPRDTSQSTGASGLDILEFQSRSSSSRRPSVPGRSRTEELAPGPKAIARALQGLEEREGEISDMEADWRDSSASKRDGVSMKTPRFLPSPSSPASREGSKSGSSHPKDPGPTTESNNVVQLPSPSPSPPASRPGSKSSSGHLQHRRLLPGKNMSETDPSPRSGSPDSAAVTIDWKSVALKLSLEGWDVERISSLLGVSMAEVFAVTSDL